MSTTYVFPTKTGSISSYFGASRDGGARSHAGVDVAVPVGTPVRSMAGGEVVYTGYTSQRGNYMKVQNSDGTLSLYQHLNGFDARVGDRVSPGQRIATSGNTGVGTGPHLHYELFVNGSAVDPLSVNYYGAGNVAGIPTTLSGSVASILPQGLAGIGETLNKYWWAALIFIIVLALVTKK